MAAKQGRWRTALVLLLGLVAPTTVSAGPYFGDWSWTWHQAKNCPHGVYSPLHYTIPQAYWARSPGFIPRTWINMLRGPVPPVLRTLTSTNIQCRSLLPMPSAPYADPTAYYGRPVAPE